MLQDLATITPSLVVCVAFLMGVRWFLRREMAPKAHGRGNTEGEQAGGVGAEQRKSQEHT
jgi:hypothetical protein